MNLERIRNAFIVIVISVGCLMFSEVSAGKNSTISVGKDENISIKSGFKKTVGVEAGVKVFDLGRDFIVRGICRSGPE